MDSMHTLFCFNDTATTEIYTLSLHDALPISAGLRTETPAEPGSRDAVFQQAFLDGLQRTLRTKVTFRPAKEGGGTLTIQDRKSTRLNSSHVNISYAVFCLKKKNYLSATSSCD